MSTWIPLVIGGVTGTLCRYLLSNNLYRLLGTSFPYGTLAVNLLGCFLLGFFAIVAEGRSFLTPHVKLLLLVGFCGAFTTFSTFILETAQLMRDGYHYRAAFNIGGSVVLGFIALRLGVWLGDFFK